MPVIEWNDKFSVKEEMIDKHHQHLVELLNRAYDDFTNGAPVESLGVVIHDLLNYATYHFFTEERSMAENSYPELEEHREEHGRFVLKIVRIQKDFHDGNKNLSFETISLLKNWFTHHILECDARYGEFLAAKKILE